MDLSKMRTLRTIAELRAALNQPRREGTRIGLVPTMGAFHDGHLSLMRHARRDCGLVVVSLFVNPTQFNEGSDLEAYPRDEGHDAMLAGDAGVDLLFAPSVQEVYPSGFATTVSVSGLTSVLEGAERGPGHFDGVATVVTKLFNMVAPDVAYFGQKDAQQALVIRRMVTDLNMPVRIEVCPTVRESDGLAMSSRNTRLAPDERERATALSRSLRAAADQVSDGETDVDTVTAAAMAVLDRADVSTEYFQIVNGETLAPIKTIEGPALALVAARVGSTRLIDNQPLTTADSIGAYAGAQAAGSSKE
jgi:pantoate--beta-alanine ligase